MSARMMSGSKTVISNGGQRWLHHTSCRGSVMTSYHRTPMKSGCTAHRWGMLGEIRETASGRGGGGGSRSGTATTAAGDPAAPVHQPPLHHEASYLYRTLFNYSPLQKQKTKKQKPTHFTLLFLSQYLFTRLLESSTSPSRYHANQF